MARCSIESGNPNPHNDQNPSDGDALPALLSLGRKERGAAARREGGSREGKEDPRERCVFLLILPHPLAAAFAQEDDPSGTERREERSLGASPPGDPGCEKTPIFR